MIMWYIFANVIGGIMGCALGWILFITIPNRREDKRYYEQLKNKKIE